MTSLKRNSISWADIMDRQASVNGSTEVVSDSQTSSKVLESKFGNLSMQGYFPSSSEAATGIKNYEFQSLRPQDPSAWSSSSASTANPPPQMKPVKEPSRSVTDRHFLTTLNVAANPLQPKAIENVGSGKYFDMSVAADPVPPKKDYSHYPEDSEMTDEQQTWIAASQPPMQTVLLQQQQVQESFPQQIQTFQQPFFQQNMQPPQPLRHLNFHLHKNVHDVRAVIALKFDEAKNPTICTVITDTHYFRIGIFYGRSEGDDDQVWKSMLECGIKQLNINKLYVVGNLALKFLENVLAETGLSRELTVRVVTRQDYYDEDNVGSRTWRRNKNGWNGKSAACGSCHKPSCDFERAKSVLLKIAAEEAMEEAVEHREGSKKIYHFHAD